MQKINDVVSVIKDQTNPFTRLVNNITHDDGTTVVPYYQTEEIKDACYQSDYACESCHKAIMARLEHKSAITQFKTLCVIRSLLIDGPASFNAKMGTALGKVIQLAQLHDTRKDTYEDNCKKMAQAIHACLTGDSKSLMNVGELIKGGSSTGANSQGLEPGSGGKGKSNFQVQQEKEQKMFRKKQQQEKKGAECIIGEKLYDQFDASQGAGKMVDKAINSAKKKFAPEEVASFVECAVDCGMTDVCAALDNALRDGRNSLAVRYKVLVLIEAVVRSNNTDAITYFESHNVGVQRHTTLERSDNPTKSQMTQQLAQTVMTMLGPGIIENRSRGTSFGQPQPQQRLRGESLGQVSPQVVQQPPPPSVASSSVGNLFGGMSMKPANAGGKKAPPPKTNTDMDFWNSPPSGQPTKPSVGLGGSTGGGAGMATSGSFTTQGSFAQPGVPNNSFDPNFLALMQQRQNEQMAMFQQVMANQRSGQNTPNNTQQPMAAVQPISVQNMPQTRSRSTSEISNGNLHYQLPPQGMPTLPTPQPVMQPPVPQTVVSPPAQQATPSMGEFQRNMAFMMQQMQLQQQQMAAAQHQAPLVTMPSQTGNNWLAHVAPQPAPQPAHVDPTEPPVQQHVPGTSPEPPVQQTAVEPSHPNTTSNGGNTNTTSSSSSSHITWDMIQVVQKEVEHAETQVKLLHRKRDDMMQQFMAQQNQGE